MAPYLSELINRAAEFAAIAHREQIRKSPEARIPYIHHSVMVGLILQRAGFSDGVVAAGILHDVIEDTSVTEEILLQLGIPKHIVDVVKLLTHEKSESYSD